MSPKTTGTGKRLPAKCGTRGGLHRHRRLKEPACDACREAERVYHREHMAKVRRTERAARTGTALPNDLFVRMYWEVSPETAGLIDTFLGKDVVDRIIKETESA
jgi:hypothetical protein